MRILLGLTLITLALFSWQASGNVAAQVPATPTAAPIATPTPIPEKEQLEIAKLQAEIARLDNPFERWLLPILPGLLAFFAAGVAAGIAFWRLRIESHRLQQDRNRYEADRQADIRRREEEQLRFIASHQADAQRREEEQFRFIVEQFSKDDAAKLAAAVNIQTFFQSGERFDRFRRSAVEILIGNLRVAQTEPVRKGLMVALREGIFSLPPEGERLDLRGCNLREAEWGPKKAGNEDVGIPLRRARLFGADTHLENAFLWEAQLQEAILVGAHLQGAILWDAHLQGADLQGADLFLADLRGAHLDEICISSLKDTDWREARWDDVWDRLDRMFPLHSEGQSNEPETGTDTPDDREV